MLPQVLPGNFEGDDFGEHQTFRDPHALDHRRDGSDGKKTKRK